MPLKTVYDKIDDIPEAHRELFSEKDGKFELTGIEGIRPESEFARINKSLATERTEHTKTKESLKKWGDLSYEDVTAKLARLEELEIAGTGDKIDEKKIQDLVSTRIKAITGPLELKIRNFENDIKTRDEQIAIYKASEVRTKIKDAISKAAGKMKGLLPEAVEDVETYGLMHLTLTDDGQIMVKEGAPVMAGLPADDWLREMVQKKPYWLGTSQGTGAGGSGSGTGAFPNNPWSDEYWNRTEQTRIEKELGEEKAGRMAKAAGTELGGPRPVKKATVGSS